MAEDITFAPAPFHGPHQLTVVKFTAPYSWGRANYLIISPDGAVSVNSESSGKLNRYSARYIRRETLTPDAWPSYMVDEHTHSGRFDYEREALQPDQWPKGVYGAYVYGKLAWLTDSERYARTSPRQLEGVLRMPDPPRFCEGRQFKRWRALCAELAEHVRQALKEHGSYDTSRDIANALNDLDAFGTERVGRTAERIRDRFAQAGIDSTYLVRRGDCGHFELEDDLVQIGGGRHPREMVCQSCLDSEVVYCNDDGRHHWRGNLYYWESDDEYHLNEEDEENEDDQDPDDILSYDTDVLSFLDVDRSFTSSSSGDFHMGVELETVVSDGYRGVHTMVSRIRASLGADYVVCKHDGSIGDAGIEIVTQPTSLAKHLARFGAWDPSGLRAWNAGTCGMHVHLDSRAFTSLSLGKFLQFFNAPGNAAFLRGIAGRHPGTDAQAKSYAGWDFGGPNHEIDTPIKAVKGKNSSRYVMINITNLGPRESKRLGVPEQGGDTDTVEVRLFRASLRKERLLAQLEFTHALVVYCRTASYKRLTEEYFRKWLQSDGRGYRHLCKWLNITPNKHGATRDVARTESEPITA